MFNITSHLEINMLKPDVDHNAVTNFAVKYRCPAVVIAPEFTPMMLTDRSTKGGQFKLIAAIDFPDGKNFATDKLKTINPMTLRVEGIDILLTSKKTQIETSNEVKAIGELMRRVNPLIELRYVFGYYTRTKEEIDNFTKSCDKYPPHMIRIDQHLVIPNVGAKEHAIAIERIRSMTARPLKVSGNIDATMIDELLKIDNRLVFDVTLQQALHITGELAAKAVNAAK
jgi:hypothetical protein